MRLSLRAMPAGIALFVVITLAALHARAADVTVCVDVRTKSWAKKSAAPPPKPAKPPPESDDQAWKQYARDAAVRDAAAPPAADAHEFDAAAYLGRMIEYEVTHEVGFSAVKSGCSQKLDVELYPLSDGWTVFARYSGNQREEKVDYAGADELAVLAGRLARALLRDVPVSESITRRSVLRADTEQNLRT